MPRSSAIQQYAMPSVSVADSTEHVWSRYYGKAPYISQDMLASETRKQVSAPDLPAAYVGQNYHIPSIVEELVLTTDNWYTTVAAPIRYTDQISYNFNKTIYDARLPKNTPHKGASRILDFRKSQQSGRLTRSGQAYEMEADFMDTPEGQEHYAYTLNQLANGIIMDINIGVINEYLNCTAWRRADDAANGMAVSTDFADKISQEIEMFAIIQKAKNGLKKLDAKCDEMIRRWNGVANMWIFPPKVNMWVKLVPPESTDYYLNGLRQSLDVTDATAPMGTINGKPVYLTRMEDETMELSGRKNLLAREREIGSFYTMTACNHMGSSEEFYRNYSGKKAWIKVYDEPNDDWALLSIQTAHDSCHVYDKDGNVILPKHDRTWAHLPDREHDMLSYTDESGQRKAVRLFGHLSRNHFSTKSTIDLCNTFVAYAKRENGSPMDFNNVETALKEGKDLFEKISDRRLTLNWFFNVLIERFVRSGVSNTKLPIASGRKGVDAWVKLYESITNVTKRTSTPMHFIDQCFLPSYDYYSALEAANATYEGREEEEGEQREEREEGEEEEQYQKEDTVFVIDPETNAPVVDGDNNPVINLDATKENAKKRLARGRRQKGQKGGKVATAYPIKTFADLKAKAMKGELGGSSSGVGSLAGFGNWDGFLAMQAELNAGPGPATGYTKHGYLQMDCEVADRYVKAVKSIARSSQFIFQNDFYLNSSRAADYVENPTVEHVINENILGVGGAPAWLDVSAISNIAPPGGKSSKPSYLGDGSGLDGKITSYLEDARRSSDVTLALIERALKKFADKAVSKSELVPALLNRIGFLFGPYNADPKGRTLKGNLNNTSDGQYDGGLLRASANNPMYRLLRTFLPFNNLSVGTTTYTSLAEREILVRTMAKMIMDNPALSDTDKIVLLDSFVVSILKSLGILEVVNAIDGTASSFLKDLLTKRYNVGSAELRAFFTAKGLTIDPTTFVPTGKTPQEAVSRALRAITDPKSKGKVLAGLKDKMDVQQYTREANETLQAAFATDAENRSDNPHTAPILYMLNLSKFESFEEANDATSDVSKGAEGVGSSRYTTSTTIPFTVDGRFGEEGGRKDRREALGEVEVGTRVPKFFRSTLTLSASQIVDLKNIIDTTEPSGTTKMRLRVSDPSDPAERFIDPGNMTSLVKRIEELNDSYSSSRGYGDGEGMSMEEGRSSLSSLQHEPYFLFHPSKAAVRDVTLASAISKLETSRKYASVSRGLGGHLSSGVRSYKRSRGAVDIMGPNKRQRIYASRVTVGDGMGGGSDSEDYGDGSDLVSARRDSGYMGGMGSMGDYDERDDFLGAGGAGGGRSRPHYPGEGDFDEDIDAAYEVTDVGSLRRTVGINSSNEQLTPQLIASLVELGGSTNSLYLKTMGKIYLTSKFNRSTMNRFIRHDILLPVGFQGMQLHKRYVTYAGILVQGGENTAVTLVGHSNLALQNDASTKTHLGHFTTYDRTVVKNDRNVLVQYDIFMDGYLGGSGVTPIHPAYYDPTEGKTGGGDIIWIMVPYEEEICSNVIDASGRFIAAETNNYVDQKRMNLSTYSQCWRANLTWHFRRQSSPLDTEPPSEGNSPCTNFVAIRGQQFNYSEATGDYTEEITNKGHLGPEGPGSAAGRKGGLEPLYKKKTYPIS